MAPERTSPPHAVLGVLGSSGGLGASTLTAALGLAAARDSGPVVCVDGHLGSGGLDVTACVEHQAGLRWGDLAGAKGEIDGQALISSLPRCGGARVLSAGPLGSPAPPAPVVRAVLRALRPQAALTLLDLPSDAAGDVFRESCDALVLLTGVTARHLADAQAATALAMRSCPDVWLVVRGGPRGAGLPEGIAAHLDLPLLARWPDDARVALDAERGRPPGESPRSRLAGVCETVLSGVALWPSRSPGAGVAR